MNLVSFAQLLDMYTITPADTLRALPVALLILLIPVIIIAAIIFIIKKIIKKKQENHTENKNE